MAPPIGSPLGQWHGPVGGVDADLDDREVTLQEGGDGDLEAGTVTHRPPLNRGGYCLPPQHTHGGTKVGHP